MTTQERDKKPEPPQIDWFDRISKLFVPILGSVVITFIAIYGDKSLTNYTSRQENARLITELQIQREQAESDLRKDIFEQALGALMSQEELNSPDLSWSKRLLKLELLAENFGGTLSITPLFSELDRDLEKVQFTAPIGSNTDINIRAIRNRLRNIAKRQSQNQLSSLAQHGDIIEIKIDLKKGGKQFANFASEISNREQNNEITYSREFKWPEDIARRNLGPKRDWTNGDEYDQELAKEIGVLGTIEVNNTKRYVTVTLGALDPVRKEVSVTLEICWNLNNQITSGVCDGEFVRQTFDLNYFNFPKINNTRLSDNQRFAMVMEDYDTENTYSPRLELAAVIFPSEFSSLRDRPSMQESVNLLKSVLQSD